MCTTVSVLKLCHSLFCNCALAHRNRAPAYKGFTALQGLPHSCMCTQPAQERCCCARLYSATATGCMAFRAPPQSMGPCSSCTATVWRRHVHVFAIATSTPLPKVLSKLPQLGPPHNLTCCRSPCWRLARAQVRLTGQRQLGCYHKWTMDAAVAQRGAEAAAYAAVGLSDNSVRVYALQRGGLQVRLCFWHVSCMQPRIPAFASVGSSMRCLGSADCPNHTCMRVSPLLIHSCEVLRGC